MVGVPLKQLLNLEEVVLFSQLDSLIPLIEQDAAVNRSLHVPELEVGVGGRLA